MVLLAADAHALPGVFVVVARARDDQVGAEAAGREVRDGVVDAARDVAHARQVHEVQGVGVGEGDDGLVAERFFARGVAEDRPEGRGVRAEEREWFLRVEAEERFEVGGDVAAVVEPDGKVFPDSDCFGGVGVVLGREEGNAEGLVGREEVALDEEGLESSWGGARIFDD